MKRIFNTTCFLLAILTLSSCAAFNAVTVGSYSMVAGHFIAGRDAENSGDLEVALQHYKKARDDSVKIDDLGRVPTKYFPDDTVTAECKQYLEEGKRVDKAHCHELFISLGTIPLSISDILVAYQRVYSQIGEYLLTGYLNDAVGKPLSNITVAFQRDLKDTKDAGYNTQTDKEGYYTFQVKGRGKLMVDKPGPFYSPVSLGIVPFFDGHVEVLGHPDYPNVIIPIVIPFSPMVNEFDKVNLLKEAGDYDAVIYDGKKYITVYGGQEGARVQEVESLINDAQKSIMSNAFQSIIRLKEVGKYDAVISEGNKYIAAYGAREGSRAQEMESFISDAQKSLMTDAFQSIVRLKEAGDYEAAITEGKNYIEKYHEAHGNRLEEVEKLIGQADALIVKKAAYEKMLSDFQTLIDLNEKGDFDSVIEAGEKGKDYLVRYKGVENNSHEEIEKIVRSATLWGAEEKKREAEAEARCVLVIKQSRSTKDYSCCQKEIKKFNAKELGIGVIEKAELRGPVGENEFERKKSAKKLEETQRCFFDDSMKYDILGSPLEVGEYDFERQEFKIEFGYTMEHLTK